MNILAIDASGVAGSVAYYKEGRLVGEYYICDGLTHSQTIMPMLEHMKKLLSISLDDVEAVAVTSGPGSFTGLRIGVATAKAMAMALDVPVIGIPTLDVIAQNILYTDHLICPIMDARRSQVYTATYEYVEQIGEDASLSGQLVRQTAYEAIPMTALLSRLAAEDKKVVFLGDGVEVFGQQIREVLGTRAIFAPPALRLQRASALVDLAVAAYERGEAVDADSFVPMYLRKSQAEREREERLGSGN